MAKQVPWNKVILEHFIETAMLTEEEESVIRTRVAGWSRVKQSMELGLSTATIDRIIKRLKVKYDNASRIDPILPPRKFTVSETYKEERDPRN